MSQDEIKTLAGNVALELGCNVDEKTGYISTDISMERGQALHIDLALTGNENRYEVKSWYVYDSVIMRLTILCLCGVEISPFAGQKV